MPYAVEGEEKVRCRERGLSKVRRYSSASWKKQSPRSGTALPSFMPQRRATSSRRFCAPVLIGLGNASAFPSIKKKHHSITASQHHSITASQHHSITASQHHSITASDKIHLQRFRLLYKKRELI